MAKDEEVQNRGSDRSSSVCKDESNREGGRTTLLRYCSMTLDLESAHAGAVDPARPSDDLAVKSRSSIFIPFKMLGLRKPLTPQPHPNQVLANKRNRSHTYLQGANNVNLGRQGPISSTVLQLSESQEIDHVSPKVKRRPNLRWNRQKSGSTNQVATAGFDKGDNKVPERVVSLISHALTDMFFLGSAIFASMQLVTTSFNEEQFKAREVVVREGDEGDRMFVIASGSVEFFKRKHRGDVNVGEAREGHVFGELALFYGDKRAVTVVAGRDGAHLWSIRRDQFRDLAAVDADARSLTLRAVTLRSTPSLLRLTRRQIYTLARLMKAFELEPGAVFADDSIGNTFQSLLLIQDGSVKVTGMRLGTPVGAETLHAFLFPQREMISPLVTVDDDGLLCDASALLGLHTLVNPRKYDGESKNVHADKGDSEGIQDDIDDRTPKLNDGKKPMSMMSENVANYWNDTANLVVDKDVRNKGIELRVVSGPSGCRGHSVTTANVRAHLGANVSQLIFGTDFDFPEKDMCMPRSPLSTSYLSIDRANTRSPSKEKGEPRNDGTFSRGDFTLLSLLGHGAYGHVVRALLRKEVKRLSAAVILSEIPSRVVALKILSKARIVELRQVTHVLDERRLLSRMHHPNVMRLFSSFQDCNTLYLVTEYIDGPDLWSVIYEPQTVGYEPGKLRDATDTLLRLYCACIVHALSHIHNHGIVYRDLKPENLIVARNGYLKVVDFGFAKQLPFYTATRDNSHTTKLHAHFKAFTLCGTGEYLSPEVILGSGHDWCTDIWAAACVFHELAVGTTPFIERHGEPNDVIFQRVLQSRVKPFIPPYRLARRKFMSRLVVESLKFEPTERLGAEELLQHNSFEGIDWELLIDQYYDPDWTPLSRERCATLEEPSKGEIFDELIFPDYDGEDSIFEAFSSSLPN